MTQQQVSGWWHNKRPGATRCAIAMLQIAILLCTPCKAAFSNEDKSEPSTKASPSDLRTINELTTKVLLKENDLERYFTNYRLHGSQGPKFAYTRYFTLQQTAVAILLSSDLTNLVESGHHLQTPQNLSIPVLKRVNKLGLISSVFEGGSSALELSASGIQTVSNQRKKADPATARNEFIRRLKEIDSLLAERNTSVKAWNDIDNDGKGDIVAILKAEGEVLKYFRDLRIYEFADAYANVRSYQSSINVYYVVDVTASSIYFASWLLGLRSFSKSSVLGPASVTGIVGDCFGIIGGPASAYSYRLLYKHWCKRLERQLKEKIYDPEAKILESMRKLKERLSNADAQTLDEVGQIQARLTSYDYCSKRFDQLIDKRQRQLLRSQKVAQQDYIFGPLIGMAFLGEGVVDTVAAYKYPLPATSFNQAVLPNDASLTADSITASNTFTSAKRGNELAFAGSISSTTGSGSALGLSALSYLDSMRVRQMLSKQHVLPSQLMESRLRALDDLDGKIGVQSQH